KLFRKSFTKNLYNFRMLLNLTFQAASWLPIRQPTENFRIMLCFLQMQYQDNFHTSFPMGSFQAGAKEKSPEIS
ncbi:hypothetical protein, partial [Novacetimonas hansenii]|uniref:hypothetical protein n=1 Tax=Novacetimonas hansenii TaxID=436 RepID=UPI0039ECEAA8